MQKWALGDPVHGTKIGREPLEVASVLPSLIGHYLFNLFPRSGSRRLSRITNGEHFNYTYFLRYFQNLFHFVL